VIPFKEGGQHVLDEDEEQEESASTSLVRPCCLKERGDGNGSNEETAAMTELYGILKMFVYAAEDDVYTVKVNSTLKLNMVAKFVATGVSFCQASKLYQTVKEETGMGVLGSVSEYEVVQLCRIVLCAINLQYLKELFKKVWAFQYCKSRRIACWLRFQRKILKTLMPNSDV
jgi:hypothetical protein